MEAFPLLAQVDFDPIGVRIIVDALAEVGISCNDCVADVPQTERAIAEMGKRDMLTGGLRIKTSNVTVIQNPLVGARPVPLA